MTAPPRALRVVRTRGGARLMHGRNTVSELLAQPGPTHGVFDVIAASVAALIRGPRLCMLGFAAGGILAPLRAAGFGGAVLAVDLSRDGVALFREIGASWCGDVRVAEAEASAWLAAQPGPFDAIIEDLSVQVRGGDVTKPRVSAAALPELIASRLSPGGVAVLNMLDMPGWPWPELMARVTAPFASAVAVRIPGYVNRVLVAGDALPPVRELGRALRGALRGIGSTAAGTISIRAVAGPATTDATATLRTSGR